MLTSKYSNLTLLELLYSLWNVHIQPLMNAREMSKKHSKLVLQMHENGDNLLKSFSRACTAFSFFSTHFMTSVLFHI